MAGVEDFKTGRHPRGIGHFVRVDAGPSKKLRGRSRPVTIIAVHPGDRASLEAQPESFKRIK